MNKNFFTKNSSLRTTVCLLLLIPIVIAIVFALTVDPNSVSINNLSSVSVKTPYGTTHRFEEKSVLDLYTSMSQNSKEIEKNFRDFSKEEPYTVVFTENNAEPIEYKLYVSESTLDYVYSSPDGKYYLVDESVAKNLSTREELAVTDTSSILPTLLANSFSKTVELVSKQYDWTYTDKNGTSTTLSSADVSEIATVKFDMSENGNLTFECDKQPDSVNLTIKDSHGEIRFDGDPKNLSESNQLTYANDELLKASLVAEWYNIDSASYHGKVTYNFKLLYDVDPTYKFVNTSLKTGDFTVLVMENFNDGEQLTLKNDLQIPEKLNVYDCNIDGKDVKITFIPYGSTASVGEHELVLSTDSGHEETRVQTVRDAGKEYTTKTVVIEDKELATACTDESIAEFENLIATLTSKSANEKLYNESNNARFEYPTGSSEIATGGATFGTKYDVISITSPTNGYISTGYDLKCAEGEPILAANDGKVVFADKTTLYGNTVIVDHGYGILSVYGNLDSISVSAGDNVLRKETELGKAGSTGFALSQSSGDAGAKRAVMCHYGVSMNGVFISPNNIYTGIFFK